MGKCVNLSLQLLLRTLTALDTYAGRVRHRVDLEASGFELAEHIPERALALRRRHHLLTSRACKQPRCTFRHTLVPRF